MSTEGELTLADLIRRAHGYEVRYARLTEEAIKDMHAAMDVTNFSEVAALGAMMRVHALSGFHQGIAAFNEFLLGDLQAIRRTGDALTNDDYAAIFAHFPLYRAMNEDLETLN